MRTAQTNQGRNERISVICPYGIGNLVMTLPALLTLRRGFPHAELHLVSLLPSTTHMLERFPLFNELYDELHQVTMPKHPRDLAGAARSVAKLRLIRAHKSLVTFPSLSFHYNVLNFATGARMRVGAVYPDSTPGVMAWLNTHQHRVVVGAHDVEQNLMMVRMLGTPTVEHADFSAAREYYTFDRQPIIGFHTGCKAGHTYKQWAPAHFATVISRVLADQPHHRVRMFFGPDERDQQAFFEAQPFADRIEFVSGVSLWETTRLIGECTAFVSNDSGLMHLAVLTGCPSIVAVLGPSDPDRTGPYDPNAKVLRSDLPCMPCSHSYTIASRNFHCVRDDKVECMKRVTPERVYRELASALTQRTGVAS
jgi:heptosyltransferase-2